MKEHMEMLSRKTHDEFISYQIKREFVTIMGQMVGGSIYGKKITKDSPVEDLVVMAYWLGTMSPSPVRGMVGSSYIKDN